MLSGRLAARHGSRLASWGGAGSWAGSAPWRPSLARPDPTRPPPPPLTWAACVVVRSLAPRGRGGVQGGGSPADLRGEAGRRRRRQAALGRRGPTAAGAEAGSRVRHSSSPPPGGAGPGPGPGPRRRATHPGRAAAVRRPERPRRQRRRGCMAGSGAERSGAGRDSRPAGGKPNNLPPRRRRRLFSAPPPGRDVTSRHVARPPGPGASWEP